MTHNFGPWIIHEGNECPVEPGDRLQILCLGEKPIHLDDDSTLLASHCIWNMAEDSPSRIFAYRKVIAPKRVKVQGYLYQFVGETLDIFNGHEPEGNANFTLSVEIDENGKPIPGTVRLEDA